MTRPSGLLTQPGWGGPRHTCARGPAEARPLGQRAGPPLRGRQVPRPGAHREKVFRSEMGACCCLQ